MKIGLLGTGKTGSKVQELHEDVVPFDSSNPPNPQALSGVDVVISFLPGTAFLEYLDMLIEAGKPVATGSTGFEWPDDIDQRLKEQQLSWIKAHNFSLGMNVVRQMIQTMSHLSNLFDDGQFKIHEIHHVHKKDAPSGTALSWKEWLDRDANITSAREGDEVGFHRLTFDCADERIVLSHQAKDRSIFARGAIWAAELLHSENELPFGLLDFNELVRKKLNL